ncbi:hypothetical protein C8R45DRAFT_1150233 [Mycena sanguinolenta]|nr:hypothetical protein C8R45DRAFT_1150233 [Mycena sanguinolenta]
MPLFKIQNPNIRDRLRYNILPSDVEKAAIQLSIDFAKSRLAEIEAHDTTQDSNVAFRRYISDYSSLLAPIRRLSVEILLLIFLDPDLHDSKWIGPNQVMIVYRPYAIGGVSYHWREVTRATPMLWSSFQISFRRRQCTDLERIRTALELSKHLTLSISFGSAYMYPEDGSSELRQHIQAVTEIAAEILLHAERWGRLVVPLERNFLDLLSPARGRLLCLQELGFGDVIGMELEKIRIFEDAPELRSVSMTRPSSMEYLPFLPWKRLIQVSTFMHTRLSIERMLQRSPQLSGLVLYTTGGSDSGHLDSPQRSPNLRTLVLNGYEGGSCLNVLGSMDTPVLKEMYLRTCWAWNPVAIPALLRRSGCSLEILVLEQSRIRPAELLALFSEIPTLSTLVLLDNPHNAVTNMVLEALIPRGSGGGVLPSLHTLVLRGTYLFGTDKLLALLESRMCSNPPLINIDIIHHGGELRTSDLDRFAALSGRGVQATYLPRVLRPQRWLPGVSLRGNSDACIWCIVARHPSDRTDTTRRTAYSKPYDGAEFHRPTTKEIERKNVRKGGADIKKDEACPVSRRRARKPGGVYAQSTCGVWYPCLRATVPAGTVARRKQMRTRPSKSPSRGEHGPVLPHLRLPFLSVPPSLLGHRTEEHDQCNRSDRFSRTAQDAYLPADKQIRRVYTRPHMSPAAGRYAIICTPTRILSRTSTSTQEPEPASPPLSSPPRSSPPHCWHRRAGVSIRMRNDMDSTRQEKDKNEESGIWHAAPPVVGAKRRPRAPP